jgi:hypothetical protein
LSYLLAGAHDGVSGAALLSLQNELDAQRLDSGAHLFRLMAHDDIDVFGRNDLLGCFDNMRQQRLACYLMKHFGALGFKPGAFSRRHDYDGKIMIAVDFLVVH